MITHVVVFWTDKPMGEDRKKLLQGASELLADIPGVRNFRVGPAMASPRAVVDDSFAVALCMDFDTREELEAYAEHPGHQRFVADYVKPLGKRMVVYDIES